MLYRLLHVAALAVLLAGTTTAVHAATDGAGETTATAEDASKDGSDATATEESSEQSKKAPDPGLRCTPDGSFCIKAANYIEDVCKAIESQALVNRLDPNFFARLLWKESLFEPSALSPAGAQGIAQFMPGTALIVGLEDPFNPAEAISASAGYLRKLIDGFGNIGLAAVAYNGGEARATRFQGGSDALPWETQDYVLAITGHDAWKWRDDPPEEKVVDLRLDEEAPFHDACVKLAGNRTLKEFTTPERAWPWGVILASHPKQSGAAAQVSRLNRQLRPMLGGKRVGYVRKRMRGMPRPVFTAQVGYSSRKEAMTLCTRLRATGAACMVLKN